MVRSHWLLLPLAVTACRAEAVERALPVEPVAVGSSSASAPPAQPVAKRAARPEAPPDPEALPCPSGRASCDEAHPSVARGIARRAERYLEGCRECKQKAAVEATLRSMRAVVERDERSRKRRDPKGCASSAEIGSLVSPDSVMAGDRPKVVFATDRALDAELVFVTSDGSERRLEARGSGATDAPWFRVAELDGVELGEHRVELRSGGRVLACRRLAVTRERRPRSAPAGAWRSVRSWGPGEEALYSAWITLAFDAPEGTRWKGIARVLGDRERNLLFDHFREKEDSDPERLALDPDCADAPFLMRAYFAWKLGLPFGFHKKSISTPSGPPRYSEWVTNDSLVTPGVRAPGLPSNEFRELARALKEDITARTLRTAYDDDGGDLYPVELRRSELRPGVVFADPYGHTLTIVKWVEAAAGRPGRLLAVDAQPDGTLGMRRFWRGNFLFSQEHATGGFGFKAFRPIVKGDQGPRLLDNGELSVAAGFPRFSLAQSKLGPAEFYARMSELVSPDSVEPRVELEELIGALMAQLERRVDEVSAAEEIVAARRTPVDMPEGRAMFQSTGAWEAVSTPCRDLRLLVGLDSVLGYPAEAAARAASSSEGESVRRELETYLSEQAKVRAIEYTRSDATKQRLTLQEIIRRRARFELAYNPNDCPELRWGAEEGGAELTSCRRRAPDSQKRRMDQMRYWFARRYSCG
ncbi:MAG: hypothetical protein U0263_17885 [Polyangiaceae bacterium]